MKLSEKKQELFRNCLRKIVSETEFLSMGEFIQHGQTSCLWHSIAVAYYSLCVAQYFHLICNEESLVYGALLHDYFLYDWHIKDKSHRLHGFTHAKTSLKNARKHWNVDKVQSNIIRCHMFPLTPIPPCYKESIIVCLVDKYCSIREIFLRDPYEHLRIRYEVII